MVKIVKFVFNSFQENTFVVWDEESLDAFVIDPGAQSDNEIARLEGFIDERKLHVSYVVATHGHLDHTAAVNHLTEKYGALFAMSKKDTALESLNRSIASMMGHDYVPLRQPDCSIKEGDVLEAGSVKLRVIETPGHTPGGVSLFLESEGMLFAGDTLFKGSIGRTDFPMGSYPDLMNSILKKLMVLPMETVVLTGHGDNTDLAEERDRNPFIGDVINGDVDATI